MVHLRRAEAMRERDSRNRTKTKWLNDRLVELDEGCVYSNTMWDLFCMDEEMTDFAYGDYDLQSRYETEVLMLELEEALDWPDKDPEIDRAQWKPAKIVCDFSQRHCVITTSRGLLILDEMGECVSEVLLDLNAKIAASLEGC